MNDKKRNISAFRKLSAYIMQDNQLHGNLTVEEAMNVATNLKLSTSVPKEEKRVVVSISIIIIQYKHQIYNSIIIRDIFRILFKKKTFLHVI